MDLRWIYDFTRTAAASPESQCSSPTRWLKDSIGVAALLWAKLSSRGRDDVATFGSCCVDEVAASHVDADCVVHYGHTTSTLPAFIVFGKSAINVDDCVKFLSDSLSATPKPALILFGLEYAYAIEEVKSALVQQVPSLSNSEVHFAEVKASVIKLANSSEKHHLVERAKDASIVEILVGILGVAGYLNMIYQMKDLIVDARKRPICLSRVGQILPSQKTSPECDVFIYVSCAQTALLDSKEFLAPVIPPFEAMLAFKRGSQWTGAYVMEFRDLISSSALQLGGNAEATRFPSLKADMLKILRLKIEKRNITGVLFWPRQQREP